MIQDHNAITAELAQTAPFGLVPFEQINTEDVGRYGGKGVGLARLAQHGLAVPPGAVLEAGAYNEFVATGTISEQVLDDVTQLADSLGGNVALRSSATIEDGEAASLAGVFETHYIRNADREQLRDTLSAMYAQAASAEVASSASLFGMQQEDLALAVVVQQLVDEPSHAGVIYAAAAQPRTVIQYVKGYGSTLVDGQKGGSSLVVDRGTRDITHSVGYDDNPLPAERLAELLDQVEQALRVSTGHRDIEFAISSDGKAYILQDRPLPRAAEDILPERTAAELVISVKDRASAVMADEMTRLGTEQSILSMANFSELLPNPTAMDIGVFSYIFPGYRGQPGAIQVGRRQIGYPLGDASVGYMHYIGGRVYESLAGDSATYYAGFPDTEQEYVATLTKRYLEAAHDDPSLTQYPEMGLYLQDPTFEELADIFDAERAFGFMERYKEFSAGMAELADQFLETFENEHRENLEAFIARKRSERLDALSGEQLQDSFFEVLEHMRLQSCVDFVKAARLGFYYTQRLRSLLSENLGLEGDELITALSKLSQGLEGSRITETNLLIADAPTDEKAYGLTIEHAYHYPADGEALQLRHSRFGDDPASARDYAEGIRSGRDYRRAFEHQKTEREAFQKELLLRLASPERESLEAAAASMQRYMAMRETVKDVFTREYALLRDRLLAIASQAGLSGNDVFHLYPEEIGRLVRSSKSVAHLTRDRAVEFSRVGEIVMPRILMNDNLEAIGHADDDDSPFTRAEGGLIAPGSGFDGVVVNLDEFADLEEARQTLESLAADGSQILLAARQLNLTHDPFVSNASGLVLQNAGFVSHGAQRAREMGVGALSGISVKKLKTGLRVRFDPQTRTIEKIAATEDNRTQ